MLAALLRGDDEVGEFLAQRLGARPAEDRVRLRVPFADAARLIDLDEAIQGHVDDVAHHALAVDQRFLHLHAAGDVARDLGEADEPVGVVADCVDHHAREEARAVLAHAPAIGFVAALRRGLAQRALRHTGLAVGVGVEAREMLADDLVRGIALDALGAAVPGEHDAGRIEHVDRVVDDAAHQRR